MKLLLKILLILLNFPAAIVFLMSLLSTNVSPADSWMIAASGLLFPVLVIVNFVFVVVWFLLKSYFVLPSAFLLIVAFPTISHTLQLNLFKNEVQKPTLKIMTFNVRGFDFYEYLAKQGKIRDSIFAFVNHVNPDIFCMQEFFTSNQKKFNTISPLTSGTEKKYFYLNDMNKLHDNTQWGLLTVSKYPIVNKRTYYFDENYPFATYCDIKIHNDTLRVFNVHLRSFHFSQKEREVFELMFEQSELPSEKDSKGILKRFKTAYTQKTKEVDSICKVIKASPHRVVVMGDLNDPASSYAYHEFTEKLEDAFVESGSGYGKTFAGKLPLLRIDYLLHDESIQSYNYHKFDRVLSDHFAVSCELKINP